MNLTPDLRRQAQLAARLHDPPEKALVLMRTDKGHEGGTTRTLLNELFPKGTSPAVKKAVKQADHWASAADRAAFPTHEDDGHYPRWQQVQFHKQPVMIHPLTGDTLDLKSLSEVDPDHAEAVSSDHLTELIHRNDGQLNEQRTALAFWRFGPELKADGLSLLWPLLPADSRVPDHSIWDHTDLTAALAACHVESDEGGPALFSVSIGPVQEVIAAARSTSDLWAGSHLLSRLSWEAMRVVCEALGPEHILFPRLRGVPQVDIWLRDQMGVQAALFDGCEWTRSHNDANPLFTAALPNRFTALVPAGLARDLGEAITLRLREFVREQAGAAWRLLLAEAGVADDPTQPAYAQIQTQLAEFPQVHWASVPWSLVDTDEQGKVQASTPTLQAAMAPFFGTAGTDRPAGFLATPAWGLLSDGLTLEDGWFYRPNPGALYPALHELLERTLAAVKSTRTFEQQNEMGWRCSLSGEVEWLCTDRSQLALPPGQRKDTLWAKVAAKRPQWVRAGEHLGALATLKRLWPSLVLKNLGVVLDGEVSRFVISTHSMAVAGTLQTWLQRAEPLPADLKRAVLAAKPQRVALPRRLRAQVLKHPDAEALLRLPGWLEGEQEDAGRADAARKLLGDSLGQRPETYYGLLLMDGDEMGAWLSAGKGKTLSHQQCMHPGLQSGFDKFKLNSPLRLYLESARAPNPARHMAISDALNQFALRLVPQVVERHFSGRVIYAGGDDVLAMLPVGELLPAATALRAVYSGVDPSSVGLHEHESIDVKRVKNGFAVLEAKGQAKQLLRVMGERATASTGLVVAHHQAPLSAVLRELRSAESRAKNAGGRDAFSISLIKRSGGALELTAKWGEPMALLLDLVSFLRQDGVSRRAVYQSIEWLDDLPPDNEALLASLLAWQLKRQGGESVRAASLASRLARLAHSPELRPAESKPQQWLGQFMQVAEFLAREARGLDDSSDPAASKDDQ
jgi:CRISPR-associated protein Cmr2